MVRLISFAGLPGVGKTHVARALAPKINAVYLRVDSAEAALKSSALTIHNAKDAGYQILAGLARDNLMLGRDVIVDTVNPVAETRALWTRTAIASEAQLFNIEVVCPDKNEHRRRVETRQPNIEGHALPGWARVLARRYDPWQEDRLVVDTSTLTPAQCVAQIIAALQTADPA